jgi:hypothetical protein
MYLLFTSWLITASYNIYVDSKGIPTYIYYIKNYAFASLVVSDK